MPRRKPPPGRSPAAGSAGAVWLYGFHAVEAALANPARSPRRFLVARPELAERFAAAAVRPELVDRAAIDAVLPAGATHQGLALLTGRLAPPDLDSVLARATPQAIILVLDQVTDPHNVGAILRSAAAFGALAVVTQDRHAPEETGALAKAASGALEWIDYVPVVNVARALDLLAAADFWRVGLDGAAPAPLARSLRPGRLALVLGAEGEGLRRLPRERCDVLARIPMPGRGGSINVSNAAAVALYELVRERPDS